MKNHSSYFKSLWILALLVVVCVAGSCDEDEPAKEDTPELITQVKLTFTPTGAGQPVEVTATDPDAFGVADMEPDGPINLQPNTTYSLNITLINDLLDPTDDGHDVTKEVLEEADEHLFFFSWTGGFTNPTGNGNIDNRADAVNYSDTDSNGLPLGLSTSWTTTTAIADQTFRIILKHQPDLKSATSTSMDGETDVNLVFDLEIVE